MKFVEKRLFLKSGLVFCAIQACLYIPVHLSYTGSLSEDSGVIAVILGAVFAALTEFASFALPVAAAMIIFLSYAYRGLAHALVRVLVFSIPYLICTIPSNYLTYLAVFDSKGAFFFALIISLFVLIAVTAQIAALFGVMCFRFKFPKNERFDEGTLLPLECEDMFDFSGKTAKALFGAVLVQFIFALVPELYETIIYFVDKAGTYRTSELFTIVFTYLFMAAEILITYVLVFKLKNKLIYERLSKTSKEKTNG